mmetsp:Transcript_43020/g.31407  ORF Transcript_43020/g.31407 Transcript_43020/m.31407 type:complete len:352 (-) Transcript_43020:189-1244(-)|eukprot:CAMPEP_0202971494 /NCGR_PEP_ID=MMETSP1396-20130829/27932_1 /ASSEMBLY_ACC=CAM_ASM_000872 /TAXON_ID= /ORGANISM="Pseudokeronopsis sp., Strain Brazil" /LENGTH=351 /DNA_ID=CAMNT_0049700945 /DNA_START=17 /DNA_END=1072 /DNA_ORIENTATION=+
MLSATVLLALISAVSSAKIFEEDFRNPAITADLIKAVNDAKTTWRAAVPVRFANATVADVKKMLGTILPHEEGYIAPSKEKTVFSVKDSDIPESFDVRTAWPQCASISGHVRDQSSCGSCWAFGSTEAFNDRYCIATGDATTLFSPEDTVSCCTGLQCSFSMGCNGGQPSGAWNWFVKNGVVSGGDYSDINKGTTCRPYSLQSCAHHVDPPAGMVACDTLPEYSTPKCTSTCSETAYGVAFSKDKHYASDSYSVKSATNMQKELMEKGTLSVAMTVYEDFETYSGGVYQHVTGKSLGGHAIKMIGWGVENGTPYWLCVNSWNSSWGENGTFKILRGSNECGIEGSVVAGTV